MDSDWISFETAGMPTGAPTITHQSNALTTEDDLDRILRDYSFHHPQEPALGNTTTAYTDLATLDEETIMADAATNSVSVEQLIRQLQFDMKAMKAQAEENQGRLNDALRQVYQMNDAVRRTTEETMTQVVKVLRQIMVLAKTTELQMGSGP